ncbi:uncharacterized protein N0V89_007338 [Didymosphaeria variabile]|uniref:HD domain-containing protein n=1 Tax=Didymosphaeria variabile TaxID=1932322 RepID=A0A9W8XJF1_9PLEO|nr:uncharacterized protein N0V89_007338 [Didymosphaeria variabile]KAJ4351992.1 hypothetical protein N0V89_007338 [Didymosphaeria variabile]
MAPIPLEIPDYITQLYQDPQRHYHNLDHINHMLSLIPTDHPNGRELTYATWFHDCAYDPQAKHGVNETESMQHWEKHVEERGEELSDIKEIVCLMIDCTITHTVPSASPVLVQNETKTHLVQRFLDMDMDILASQRDDYLEYTRKVRREYGYFTDEDFRKGRAKFLRSELKKERLFYLDENEGKNEIARQNMRAELAMLEECL